MTLMNLYNVTTKTLIAKEVLLAQSLYARIKGLMGKYSLSKDSAMFFDDCPSVHTFFMRFPIDVVFLDKDMVVTKVLENLKPWRCTMPFQYKNRYCIEFASNKISSKISKGDLIDVRS